MGNEKAMLTVTDARPLTLYRTVKRNIAKWVLDRAPVHTGKASFGTIFVPEQDFSAALLKVERIVSDRFLKRSKNSLNTFGELKLQQDFLLVNSRLQQLGPNLIQMQLNGACFQVCDLAKIAVLSNLFKH